MTSQHLAIGLKEEGNALFKAKQYEASIRKFSEAIQLDNRNPVFYANRAASYFFLRRFREVLNDCQTALKIDPTYKKAWLRKGDAHDALTQYADSIDSYTHALSASPHQTDHDELRRRIEYVKAKLLDPATVGLETLITLARLLSIQIPHLQSIQTPPQIDELRKALFRHPKWSFPPSPSALNHKPYPPRIRFLLIPSDERSSIASQSDVELELDEREPAKNYTREIRRLLGGCENYTKEVLFADDWDTHSPQNPFGVGLGCVHAIYEVYFGLPTPSTVSSNLNNRANGLLGRANLHGPVLVTKGLYIKTDRRLIDISVTPPSLVTSGQFQAELSPNQPGNVLLGYERLTLDELTADIFRRRIGREWESTCRRVYGTAHA